MCLEIEAALDKWREDDAVKMLLIDAAGDRAFCAGGDIVHMFKEMQQNVGEYSSGLEEYFVKEYQRGVVWKSLRSIDQKLINRSVGDVDGVRNTFIVFFEPYFLH
jgi:enoyl-CoA hydratase/carnithine racemase